VYIYINGSGQPCVFVSLPFRHQTFHTNCVCIIPFMSIAFASFLSCQSRLHHSFHANCVCIIPFMPIAFLSCQLRLHHSILHLPGLLFLATLHVLALLTLHPSPRHWRCESHTHTHTYTHTHTLRLLSNRIALSTPSASVNSQKPKPFGVFVSGSSARFQLREEMQHW
jgi:hypothetical protein